MRWKKSRHCITVTTFGRGFPYTVVVEGYTNDRFGARQEDEQWIVTHLHTGLRVARVDSLPAAKKFCAAVTEGIAKEWDQIRRKRNGKWVFPPAVIERVEAVLGANR